MAKESLRDAILGHRVRLDVRALLEECGLEIEEKEEYFELLCPFPEHEDTLPSFYVHKKQGRWHCFGCHRYGKIEKLMALLWNVSEKRAKRFIFGKGTKGMASKIYRMIGNLEGTAAEEVLIPKEVPYPTGLEFLKRGMPEHDYALDRGVDMAVIEEKGLFRIPLGRFIDRVCIPLSFRDKLVGYVARDITGNAEKPYLNSFGMESAKVFFGLNEVWGQKEVMLVEGAFDALRVLSVAPKVPVVSVLKSELSPIQEYWLMRSGVTTVVLAFDNDTAGRDAIKKMAYDMREMFVVKICLPLKRDWAECSDAQVKKSLANTLSMVDYSMAFRRM